MGISGIRFTSRPARLAIVASILAMVLVACGGSPTPTPTTVPTATVAVTPRPTATLPPTAVSVATTRPGPPTAGATVTRATPGTASPAAGRGTATPFAGNPAEVTSAYANLQKLDSYHLEIKVTGLNNLLPLGVTDPLTYAIDYAKGDQHITIVDGSGGTQEAYKIGDKTYLVTNGQATDVSTLPLAFTLPEVLYSSLTTSGVMTFTAAGSEQVNGRATTKYNGTGQLARLAANPLLALALAGASGNISGPIWVATDGGYLVAADLSIDIVAPRPGTTKLRMDVTRIGQVGPITLPH